MPAIVVLSGAGLSAESGLGTFRDTSGLWTQYDLNDVATPEGFARNPQLVHDFYNARRANALASQPNAAHRALARLEAALGPELYCVTQNIDPLLEQAGMRRVVHMHGQLMRMQCAGCGHCWPAPASTRADDPCPACTRPHTRPDVVWFGEIPYHMEEIADALESCAVFVSIGTSGSVYPAAGFVQIAREAGAHTVELNLEASETASQFDELRQGPASEVVTQWVEEILAAHSGTQPV
ncbi:NAD-dependent deacylase [Fluviibacterium sp. S390]|uniref:NAD-dependent deacylase n=1 Tax=Fluviibacterium sp. S390 TaxID=3415139 RepID=UPI003C7D2C5D